MKSILHALLAELAHAAEHVEETSNDERSRLLEMAAATLEEFRKELPADKRAKFRSEPGDIARTWRQKVANIASRSNAEVKSALENAADTLGVTRRILDQRKDTQRAERAVDLADMEPEGNA